MKEYGDGRNNIDGGLKNHYYWWDLKSRTLAGYENWDYSKGQPEDRTEITFEQFEKYILKGKEMETLPKTFEISTDNEFLAKAIWADLLKLGYTEGNETVNNSLPKGKIIVGTRLISVTKYNSLDKFKELVCVDDAKVDKHFVLPQQYNEALQFAKEQLEHPYWKKKEKLILFGHEVKVGDYEVMIGCKTISRTDIENLETIVCENNITSVTIDSDYALCQNDIKSLAQYVREH